MFARVPQPGFSRKRVQRMIKERPVNWETRPMVKLE
jgi:hypothetical protein